LFGFAEGGGGDVQICESVSKNQGVLTSNHCRDNYRFVEEVNSLPRDYSARIPSQRNLPLTKYPRWNIVYFHRLHIEHLSI
jgi:hypothetical protein